MKIIDLLNKIANSEEVPEKFKYGNKEYEYDEDYETYYTGAYCDEPIQIDGDILNDEIEIIEDRPIYTVIEDDKELKIIKNGEDYYTFPKCKLSKELSISIIEDEPKKIENIKLDSEECIEYYEDGIKKHLNTNKKDKMYVKILNEIIDYINSKENK